MCGVMKVEFLDVEMEMVLVKVWWDDCDEWVLY